ATEQFRKVYPDLVRINNEPILVSFSRMFKTFINQRSISQDTRVFTYTKDEDNKMKKIF
ncbi:unnamed protein product, partial [Adineta steineri]